MPVEVTLNSYKQVLESVDGNSSMTIADGGTTAYVLPSTAGATGEVLKAGSTPATLEWGSASTSNTYSLYSTNNSPGASAETVDLTAFRAGTQEDMLVRISTSIHVNDLHLQRSLLVDMATNYGTFELSKYDQRYILYEIQNGGDTLSLSIFGATFTKIQTYVR